MIKCDICLKEYKNNRGIAIHKARQHDIHPAKRYIKNETPTNYCVQCGTLTSNKKYCSRSCYFTSQFPQNQEMATRIVELWERDDITYAAIGEQFGISRERVRQILQREIPGKIAERRLQRKLQKFSEREERRRGTRKECAMCATPFWGKKNNRYCPECSRDANPLLYHMIPKRHETHRLYMAILYLRDPPKAEISIIKNTLQAAQKTYWFWRQHGYLPSPNRTHYGYSVPVKKLRERMGEQRWAANLRKFEDYYADTSRRIVIKDPGPLPGLDIEA